MQCPKCGYEQEAGTECKQCGVIFSKIRQNYQKPEPEDVPVSPDYELGANELEKETLIHGAIGLGIALVVLWSDRLAFIFHTFITLVHEMGHAFIGWLFGYPSIPAFDFRYGGGVTIHQERYVMVLVAIYAGLAFLMFHRRNNNLALGLLIGFTVIYSVFNFVKPMHEVLNLFMGHGTELIIAVIFFYRGLSGASVVHVAERPLYFFLAFFTVFADIRFGYRLIYSLEHRWQYENAKGGGHWMDFSRIAEEYLNVDLSVVAVFFLVVCFLTPVLGFLFFRYQRRLYAGIIRLVT